MPDPLTAEMLDELEAYAVDWGLSDGWGEYVPRLIAAARRGLELEAENRDLKEQLQGARDLFGALGS